MYFGIKLIIYSAYMFFVHYFILFQEGTERDFEILAGTQDGDTFDLSQVLFNLVFLPSSLTNNSLCVVMHFLFACFVYDAIVHVHGHSRAH